MTTALEVLAGPLRHPDVDVIEFPHSDPIRPGRQDAALVVRLGAWLVVGNRQQLKQRIVDEMVVGRRWFVFDFGECGYVDTSGLGVLLSIAKKVSEAGGQLVLAELNDDLVTLLELTKMDTLLRVVPRVIDALAGFER